MKKFITYLILYLILSVSTFSQINVFKLLPGDGAAGDWFGSSVSISREYAILGSPLSNDSIGAAYIFRRVGTTWIEEQKLTASDGSKGDLFGSLFSGISMSGDYAVIGAPFSNDSVGAAYIFRREGFNWIEEQKLTVSDGKAGDSFGTTVSIYDDYLIIGAPSSDSLKGSAYIFRKEGTIWIESQKLSPSDSINTAYFGSSVSIFEDRAIVGAWFGNLWTGSAYIFRREGTNWIEEQKLTASDGVGLNYFGIAVSMFEEYVIVGAMGAQAAYVFKKENTTWIEKQKLFPSDGTSRNYFGVSVLIDGDYVIVGAPGDVASSGVAYIFRSDGVNWIEEQKLTASDADTNDIFGVAVSLYGGYAIIGAPRNDDNGESSGSAYIYNGFVVGVDNDETEIPESFKLEQNYPNPFNPSTKISWQVPVGSHQTLKIYDVLGNEVATLIDEYKRTGSYEVEWDASGLPSGIYFYQLQTNGFLETKKMILMK